MKQNLLYIFIFILLSGMTSTLRAEEGDQTDKKWHFDARIGYSVGGTIPLGFNSEIRSLNSFSPKFNLRIGGEAERMLSKRFGVQAGLYFDRKGFSSDITMRQYGIIMERGGERITGPFSGNVIINIIQAGVSLPIQATWWINKRAKLEAGPYVSYIFERTLYGYAYGNKVYDADGNWTGEYDAYLRRGESRGEKISVGDIYTDEEGNVVDNRGTFGGTEFDNYMRRFQWGINVGFDYTLTRHFGLFTDLSYNFNSAFTSDPDNPVRMGLYPLYFTLGIAYKF